MAAECRWQYNLQVNCLSDPEASVFAALLPSLGGLPVVPVPLAVYEALWTASVPFGGTRESNFRAIFSLEIVTIEGVDFVISTAAGWLLAYRAYITLNPSCASLPCGFFPFD